MKVFEERGVTTGHRGNRSQRFFLSTRQRHFQSRFSPIQIVFPAYTKAQGHCDVFFVAFWVRKEKGKQRKVICGHGIRQISLTEIEIDKYRFNPMGAGQDIDHIVVSTIEFMLAMSRAPIIMIHKRKRQNKRQNRVSNGSFEVGV